MTPTFDVRILEVLGIVLALIALDFLVGVLKALGTKTFSIQKFPSQLANFVLPYYTPLLVLGVVVFFAPLLNLAVVVGATAATFYTAAAGVALKALADIGGKLGLSFSTTTQVLPPPAPPAA